MAVSTLDDHPDYKAYKALKALPSRMPAYEVQNVGTTWITASKAENSGPGAPFVQGIKLVFGEMHCRVKVGSKLCGYTGRGALEYHIKNDHHLIIEAGKKGRPYATTVIAAKDFYAHTMRLYRLEELERLASTGGLKYQVDEVNEDSGLDNALDLARHSETKRVMKAVDSIKATKANAIAPQPANTSIHRELTRPQQAAMLQLLENFKGAENKNGGGPRHCDPKEDAHILRDDSGDPLRPMRVHQGVFRFNKAAAIKIMKFLKLDLGPCDKCWPEANANVEELKKPAYCQFVEGCDAWTVFSLIEYRPKSGQWEQIIGRRLLLENEQRNTA